MNIKELGLGGQGSLMEKSQYLEPSTHNPAGLLYSRTGGWVIAYSGTQEVCGIWFDQGDRLVSLQGSSLQVVNM